MAHGFIRPPVLLRFGKEGNSDEDRHDNDEIAANNVAAGKRFDDEESAEDAQGDLVAADNSKDI